MLPHPESDVGYMRKAVPLVESLRAAILGIDPTAAPRHGSLLRACSSAQSIKAARPIPAPGMPGSGVKLSEFDRITRGRMLRIVAGVAQACRKATSAPPSSTRQWVHSSPAISLRHGSGIMHLGDEGGEILRAVKVPESGG